MSARSTSVQEQYPDLKKWQQATVLTSPTSSQLWTGAKFIGRECAEVNKQFLECKMTKGEHPGLSIKEGDLVRLCTKNVLANVMQACGAEFTAHEICSDANDYRVEGCLPTELALINCWNNREKK
jgi:hypothetical protein